MATSEEHQLLLQPMRSPSVQFTSSQEMLKEYSSPPPDTALYTQPAPNPSWGSPTEVLLVSKQDGEGNPYFSLERLVPLWASPAALETTQSVEKEMDACSPEGVNPWLPTTVTPPVASDPTENPGEDRRVDPRGRELQKVEKTQAYLGV